MNENFFISKELIDKCLGASSSAISYAAWNCSFRTTFRDKFSVLSLRVKLFLCLALENGTDMLSRKVDNKLQFYTAYHFRRSKISFTEGQ